MLDENTNDYETYEAPPPVFVMAVAPTGAAPEGEQREQDARLIGEVVLDRFFGTRVAADLWKQSELPPDSVVVHQEVIRDETAPLTLHDNRICYPWELPEWVLGLMLDSLVSSLKYKRKRAADAATPGKARDEPPSP